MVREEFGAEPDPWQLEALLAFPHHNRLALKACKGPGKTAVLAWLIWNFMGTRPSPRIAATSITGDNLASNLWPELAKWRERSKFFTQNFTWTKSEVFNNRYPATWWCKARTWPKQASPDQQADALAGLHADYAMFIGDESGGYPQAIMATAEAVLASGLETKVVQAGNPTHLEGPLYRACVQDRALWYVVTITGDPDDPKRSSRIDIEWARQQIATYGRENPWVKINVLGEFPDTSINALLGVEEVNAAIGKHLTRDRFDWCQKRFGIDVARFGDDRTVIFARQGPATFRPRVLRNMRTTNIAAIAMRAHLRWSRDGNEPVTFVDDTGHWGHGVIDNMIESGVPAVPVIFSDRALNPRYKNRRAEMWMEMAEWVKNGGALPPGLPDIVGELTVPTYSFVAGKFVLEEKDQIKERLGRSPDLADALALTFAIPDQPAEMVGRRRSAHKTRHEFDPYATEPTETDYDPYENP